MSKALNPGGGAAAVDAALEAQAAGINDGE